MGGVPPNRHEYEVDAMFLIKPITKPPIRARHCMKLTTFDRKMLSYTTHPELPNVTFGVTHMGNPEFIALLGKRIF